MKTALKSLLLIAVTLYLIFALVKVSRPASEMLCTGVELQMADSGQVSLIDRDMVERLLAKHKIAPKGNTMGSVNTQHISKLLRTNGDRPSHEFWDVVALHKLSVEVRVCTWQLERL